MGRLKKALLPAALLIAAYWAVCGGEYTVLDLYQMRATRAEQAAEVARLQAAIDSLMARVDSLESVPEALERIARERYGLIRDGETLYRFVPIDSAVSDSASRPGSGAMTNRAPRSGPTPSR